MEPPKDGFSDPPSVQPPLQNKPRLAARVPLTAAIQELQRAEGIEETLSTHIPWNVALLATRSDLTTEQVLQLLDRDECTAIQKAELANNAVDILHSGRELDEDDVATVLAAEYIRQSQFDSIAHIYEMYGSAQEVARLTQFNVSTVEYLLSKTRAAQEYEARGFSSQNRGSPRDEVSLPGITDLDLSKFIVFHDNGSQVAVFASMARDDLVIKVWRELLNTKPYPSSTATAKAQSKATDWAGATACGLDVLRIDPKLKDMIPAAKASGGTLIMERRYGRSFESTDPAAASEMIRPMQNAIDRAVLILKVGAGHFQPFKGSVVVDLDWEETANFLRAEDGRLSWVDPLLYFYPNYLS